MDIGAGPSGEEIIAPLAHKRIAYVQSAMKNEWVFVL